MEYFIDKVIIGPLQSHMMYLNMIHEMLMAELRSLLKCFFDTTSNEIVINFESFFIQRVQYRNFRLSHKFDRVQTKGKCSTDESIRSHFMGLF